MHILTDRFSFKVKVVSTLDPFYFRYGEKVWIVKDSP